MRWSDPREGSGLPRSLEGVRGPIAGAPRPQPPFLFHFPASRLRLMGDGSLSPRGRRRKDAFPLLWVESPVAFSPWLRPKQFSPFPSVGFCSFWIRLDPLGAYWLWTIRATARCQGPLYISAPRGREVRVQGHESGPGEVGQKRPQRRKGCDQCRQRLFPSWK